MALGPLEPLDLLLLPVWQSPCPSAGPNKAVGRPGCLEATCTPVCTFAASSTSNCLSVWVLCRPGGRGMVKEGFLRSEHSYRMELAGWELVELAEGNRAALRGQGGRLGFQTGQVIAVLPL